MHLAGGTDAEASAVVWIVNEIVFTHDSSLKFGAREERPASASWVRSPWMIKSTPTNTVLRTSPEIPRPTQSRPARSRSPTSTDSIESRAFSSASAAGFCCWLSCTSPCVTRFSTESLSARRFALMRSRSASHTCRVPIVSALALVHFQQDSGNTPNSFVLSIRAILTSPVVAAAAAGVALVPFVCLFAVSAAANPFAGSDKLREAFTALTSANTVSNSLMAASYSFCHSSLVVGGVARQLGRR